MHYCYQGVTYYQQQLTYCHYNLRYDLSHQNQWRAEISSYQHEDITFAAGSRKRCVRTVEDWFRRTVDSGEVKELIRQEYRIAPQFPPILLTVRDLPVGYHISPTRNRDSILTNGLIPNGDADPIVMKASEQCDLYRPPTVPAWVVRQQAVYAHPEISNEELVDRGRKNHDLFTVHLQPSRCWVGSIGLGGFMLFDEDFTDEMLVQHLKNIRGWGRLYWRFSCSLPEFIRFDKRIQQRSSHYGLDEILVFHPTATVVHLGYWDEQGHFNPTGRFIDYVRPELKGSYLQILAEYLPVVEPGAILPAAD